MLIRKVDLNTREIKLIFAVYNNSHVCIVTIKIFPGSN